MPARRERLVNELHFCETDALSTSQKRYAENQLKLFKAWYRDWSKSVG